MLSTFPTHLGYKWNIAMKKIFPQKITIKKKLAAALLFGTLSFSIALPTAAAYTEDTLSTEEAKTVLSEYLSDKHWTNPDMKHVAMFGDGYLSSNNLEITFALYTDQTQLISENMLIGYITLNLHTQKGYIRLNGSSEDTKANKEYFDLSSENIERFTDISSQDWFYDSVQYVIQHHLFTGIRVTAFMPNELMTRAMTSVVLARLDGQDTSGGSVWYEKGVAWAKENDISDGSDPLENITREQLITMLHRYAGSPVAEEMKAKYIDSEEIHPYAYNAFAWAVNTELLNGDENMRLRPRDFATRAEVAAILTRFCEKVK